MNPSGNTSSINNDQKSLGDIKEITKFASKIENAFKNSANNKSESELKAKDSAETETESENSSTSKDSPKTENESLKKDESSDEKEIEVSAENENESLKKDDSSNEKESENSAKIENESSKKNNSSTEKESESLIENVNENSTKNESESSSVQPGSNANGYSNKNITWKGRIKEKDQLTDSNNVLNTLNELKDLVSVSLNKTLKNSLEKPARFKGIENDTEQMIETKNISYLDNKDETLSDANAVISKLEKQHENSTSEFTEAHLDDLFYVNKAQNILKQYLNPDENKTPGENLKTK